MSVKIGFRILHCLRAPVGGLFRHVCDLAAAQAKLGHDVAIICAAVGDGLTNARLEALAQQVSLGVHRIEIARNPGLSDVSATRSVMALAKRLGVDVIHGHGAKGGLYARLAARMLRRRGAGPLAFYTPHGGSLNFKSGSWSSRVFMTAERGLETMTAGLIFESAFAARVYAERAGTPRCLTRVIPNGVHETEFAPVVATEATRDILYIGEMRALKGVDVLLQSIAELNRTRPTTAFLVGSGPDVEALKALAQSLQLNHFVTFAGVMPAREAFKMGRVMAIPSRAESFPYVVLEAGAAGVPMVSTHVGGIPEIAGDTGMALIPPDDIAALTAALRRQLDDPGAAHQVVERLQSRIRQHFLVDTMTTSVLALYATAAASEPVVKPVTSGVVQTR